MAWKERSVTTYDDHFRPLTNKKYVGIYGSPRTQKGGMAVSGVVDRILPIDSISPPSMNILDATNLVSEVRWQYDDYGNVISEKTAPYGAEEFLGDTYVYDEDGRYILSKTDALGHTTTYGEYDKFGNPETETDYRGRVTSFTYDGLGNLVKTTTPDGAEAQIDVAWGGHGLYSVTKTETNRPDRVTYYDALGRDLRGGIKRFDGQWQYVDKEYDSNGRVSRISLPFRDVQAAYWNTYSYDEYGRPLSLVEASGKNSSWAYNGVSVTTVKDGITSTRTTDASGNVISVSDAGGTITYTLRNDGQPSSVAAPGNVVTSFSYDGYGRRTKIEDPSAGIQIDSCVWNSDGSSKQTHTNPNGTVVTYKDKYGRTTSVERPGEYNTTYAYDDDGRLISEQSTNGTGAEYTYDNLDRVVTSREIVPDGKWLRKNYGYGSHGELLSVQYVSQDGAITTENYTYDNGYNTIITLPDETIVRCLVSENDLGLATGIITGVIGREYGFTAFGLPTYRKIDDGNLQDFTYQFDPLTGNLLVRTDGSNNQTEQFGYDNLNRLTSIGNRVIAYADNGNITSMDGVGMMEYGTTSRPYQITSLYPESDNVVPSRVQNVSYTCYSRPSILTEGGRSAAFTYDGEGKRVKMYVADGSTQLLTRYYVGDRYEFDQTSGGTKERLYLGGDAYSAPMVLQRENGGEWTAYNICRDYLGSITHIASLDGTLVAEYSYDPWGRLRDPETLEVYAAGEEPELFLGRGFTGHEHLTWFGLINMNARLYDPLLGRFLSPDPYVQAPDFTQNFNRYSYALNNPLRYTDVTGEFLGTIITTLIRLPIAIVKGVVIPYFVSFNDPSKAGKMLDNAWKEFGQRVANAAKIDAGLFAWDKHRTVAGNLFSYVSRFTWESKQTLLGNAVSHFRNNFWRTNVEYYHGATLVNRYGHKNGWGMTLGPYINGYNLEADPQKERTFAHEYGHTKQSMVLGPLYLSLVGIPSIIGSVSDDIGLSDHHREWYEVWSNQMSYNYFDRHNEKAITSNWSTNNPRKQHVDWFFYTTMVYYASLFRWPFIFIF